MLSNIKEQFHACIPDPNVRKIICNCDSEDKYLRASSKYSDLMYNTLSFFSFVLLKLYLNWKINSGENNNHEYNNSMARIVYLLDDFYSGKKYNLSFLEDLFINIQVDTMINDSGNNSFLKKLKISSFFRFERDNLVKQLYYLKKVKYSSKYKLENPMSFEDLIDFFESIPVLKKMTLKTVDINFYQSNDDYAEVEIEYPSDDKSRVTLSLDKCLLCSEMGVFYLDGITFFDCKKLEYDSNKNQILQLEYVPFSASHTLSILYVNRDFPRANEHYANTSNASAIYCGEDCIERFIIDYDLSTFGSEANDSYFFDNYTFFNNSYIRNVALIISDALTEDIKQKILDVYNRKKYVTIFEHLKVRTLQYRWDELVIFLLLDVGIYEFIKFLLLNGMNYEILCNAFIRRYDIDEDDVFKIKNPIQNIRIVSNENKARAQARALIFLATKIFAQNTINSSERYFPVSIQDIINEMVITKNSARLDLSQKIAFAINDLIERNYFLLTFYRGLLKHAEELVQQYINAQFGASKQYSKNTTDYDKYASFDLCTTQCKKEYVEAQTFMSEMSPNDGPHYYMYAMKSIDLSFDCLTEFSDRISKRNTAENEAMYYVLGRHELFSVSRFKKHADNIKDALKKISTEEATFRHEEKSEALYAAILEYYFYLQTGESPKLEDSIYPILGTCTKSVETRDGYSYSYFSLYNKLSTDSNFSTLVKVLSDEKNDLGEIYYCVPNINRVADIKHRNKQYDEERLWINPTIIPCKAYASDMVYSFSTLNDRKDYEAVASILYSIDGNTYKGLFGTENNAKKVLPLLFEDENSVFYKNNIFIIKDDNRVKAVATFYLSEFPFWQKNLVLKAFANAKILYPEDSIEVPHGESFEKSNEYFAGVFCESIGSMNSMVCDLCVNKAYRNQGIGRSLLTNIIKLSEKHKKDIIISTYRNNKVAQHLYNSLGFMVYLSDSDKAGAKHGQEYLKMIYIVKK